MGTEKTDDTLFATDILGDVIFAFEAQIAPYLDNPELKY